MRYVLYEGQTTRSRRGSYFAGLAAFALLAVAVVGYSSADMLPWQASTAAQELARRGYHDKAWRERNKRTRVHLADTTAAVRRDFIRKARQTATPTPVATPSPSPTPLPVATPTPVLVGSSQPIDPIVGALHPPANITPNPAPLPLLAASIDHREYMHGLDFVTLGGRTMVVFSANGYMPTSPEDEWMHDMYYSYVGTADPRGSLAVKPLVAARQAQEPASAAVNSRGHMLVTSEDAQFSDYLDQTYGIWDASLKPTIAYGAKLMPPQGGHSGHVAASGDKFLVSFSDGWIDGGGVDNLGTGDEVYGRIVNDDGSAGPLIRTAVGKERDWWPIVAGSDSNWLQVWQRYGAAGSGGGTVMGAIIGHDGKVAKQLNIFDNNKYYYHDVQYVPALGMYLVVGSQNIAGSNAGIAVLIDKAGTIVATKTGLPSTVRESQTVVSSDGRTAVYTVPGVGAAVLNLDAQDITLSKMVRVDWNWDYMGTDGIFTAENRVLFATGSHKGVQFVNVGW